MRLFDTTVQVLKYEVLREVARLAWNGELSQHFTDIPHTIIPGKKPTFRCCVYKERAILEERVKLAMGSTHGKCRVIDIGKYDENPNVIQVIDIACDECPTAGYTVSDMCRGCLSHRCAENCPRQAITFDNHYQAHIDKTKCVECGQCAKACPYSAIINRKRPCQIACKVKAISINEDGEAQIDNDKCISCGACVVQCPFGAITDKSFILDAIDLIRQSDNGKNFPLYAVVAPSISSQFTYAKLGQVVTGIHRLGFTTVMEAALGADMVAKAESKELAEKGFLTSSCCPAFVSYIQKNFPQMAGNISTNLSPMATVSRFIKEHDPQARIIFIGPCTAKKMEIQLDSVRPYVDTAITFEELQALFDSRDLDLTGMEETGLDNASYFGRIFARCGGLACAVEEGLKEQGLTDFALKPYSCDGIEECRVALLKKDRSVLDANFIEGMACVGGCIGGAGVLRHGEKNKVSVNQYGLQAGDKTILGAVEAAR